MHLLTNAEMALLIEDAEAEAAQEQQPARVRGRLKRRDSAVLRGEKLTEEQITQVHTPFPRADSLTAHATQFSANLQTGGSYLQCTKPPLTSGNHATVSLQGALH